MKYPVFTSFDSFAQFNYVPGGLEGPLAKTVDLEGFLNQENSDFTSF